MSQAARIGQLKVSNPFHSGIRGGGSGHCRAPDQSKHCDRSRRRLDVIGAVTSGRAVAEGYCRAEYSGENLPADKEAQREVHV